MCDFAFRRVQVSPVPTFGGSEKTSSFERGAAARSGLFATWAWHGKDERCYLCRFIHLNEVSSTSHKKQLRPGKEFMEAPGDASIQVRICVAKDDSDRPAELSKLQELLAA
jgi:hypothetical protein